MAVPILEIRDAARNLGGREALRGVSISISAGEILALLGPNGAGKTTLMRAATGRLRLDAGSVLIAGQDPARSTAARKAIGLVPQTIALYPRLSARENLEVFGRLMGLGGRAAKESAANGLRLAHLDDRADDLLAQLSGGMQRRLNIVAGTLHQPQLLLLDEPTVGVDLRSRETIHTMLRELRDGGMGILFSTHDFEQAEAVADRAAIMRAGQILAEGNVAGLIRSVFGEAREGIVTLATAPDSATAGHLRAFGLHPSQDQLTWSGPVAGGYQKLGDIEAALQERAVDVAAVSLRNPGLGGVFRQYVDTEAMQ